jgi:hypothetical protein
MLKIMIFERALLFVRREEEGKGLIRAGTTEMPSEEKK